MSKFAQALFESQAPATSRERLEVLLTKAREGGLEWLEIHFAATPRKLTRECLRGGVIREGEVAIIAEAFRFCDLGAAQLLEVTGALDDDAALFRLYEQGDHEERRMILKALAFADVTPMTIRLLQEAHRTNEHNIFVAAFADSNLAARALDDDDFDRGLLKAAFVDLELARVLDAEKRATPALTRMLLDFMSEREAAHRPVWPGSLELGAHAPCPGLTAKVTGDLWSGVDARRLAAVGAVRVLGVAGFEQELRDRLEIEAYEPVQSAIRGILA